MKSILVLSSHPDFAEAIRASLNSEQYRVVHRHTVEEGEPLLVHGLIAACVLDADLMGVECVWIIERLRRRDARTPIIAYAEMPQSDWEEEAFLRGVTQVLTKPVRPRLFNSILDRLWSQPASLPAAPVMPAAAGPSAFARMAVDPMATARLANAAQTLNVLRDFSSIMTHSLDAEAMLKQFLQFLREILSVNRAAIFLNRPCTPLGEVVPPEESRRLRAAAAIGLSSGLLQHFELSLDSGIGALVNKVGRILRRDSDEARADVEVQKEFELLGAQVAVPVLDRESLVGVAVFDGRVTGEPLANAELEIDLPSAGTTGPRPQKHPAARPTGRQPRDDGRHPARIEQRLRCGRPRPDHSARQQDRAALLWPHRRAQRRIWNSAICPSAGRQGLSGAQDRDRHGAIPLPTGGRARLHLQRQRRALPDEASSTVPSSALLMAEDLTQSEQLRKLEVEAANLRLVKHHGRPPGPRIGNALVPHFHPPAVAGGKYKDPEFPRLARQALADGVKRVSRLINQMRFLARDASNPWRFPVEVDRGRLSGGRKQQPAKGPS